MKSRSRFAGFAASIAGLLSIVASAALHAAPSDGPIQGAGASFPAPVLQAWANDYAANGGAKVRYESVGSSEGILRITVRSVDFAMTDVPLTQAELLQDDLVQFPLVLGAVVPVVNLPGIDAGELHLSGPVLADIYLGKVTRWNAPSLRALNPGRSLPDLPIQAVHRSDGSGTSFVFTYYLSRVSDEWNERLGIGSRLHWPAGSGAKGNEGVASAVHRTAGAIGYVQLAYAEQQGFAPVRMLNAADQFVSASETSVRAALAAARWTGPGFYEVLVNKSGDTSWPIVGVSYALLHRRQEDRGDAVATLRFLDWIYRHGGEAARRLHYVPVDGRDLVKRIEDEWSQVHDEERSIPWQGQQ